MKINVETLSPKKLAECKICHDEDEDSNMEAPCSCRGSLKYAHRNCVQRWCDEKGDTICEICHQQFKPGYTAPVPLFHYGGTPMNFRGNWENSRRDLRNDSQYLSMLTTEGIFLDPDIDQYPETSSRNLICCRIVAIIFMVLLVLRHTLPFILYSAGKYSISSVMLVMLQTIGIILPIYIMVQLFTAIQRRRNQQYSSGLAQASRDEENETQQQQQQPQSHLIQVL